MDSSTWWTDLLADPLYRAGILTEEDLANGRVSTLNEIPDINAETAAALLLAGEAQAGALGARGGAGAGSDGFGPTDDSDPGYGMGVPGGIDASGTASGLDGVSDPQAELTAIEGIGPATQKALEELGVGTWANLAALSITDLDVLNGTTLDEVVEIQAAAGERSFVAETNMSGTTEPGGAAADDGVTLSLPFEEGEDVGRVGQHFGQNLQNYERFGLDGYTVRGGDTLWDIDAKTDGDLLRWWEIYERNKDTIGADPGLMFPGQDFILPESSSESSPESSSGKSQDTADTADTAESAAAGWQAGEDLTFPVPVDEPGATTSEDTNESYFESRGQGL